jgi:hypothetical protein
VITKHFFKVLTIFTAMIVFGVAGVLLINYLRDGHPINELIPNWIAILINH